MPSINLGGRQPGKITAYIKTLLEKIQVLEAANEVLSREVYYLRMYAQEADVYAAEDAMHHNDFGEPLR